MLQKRWVWVVEDGFVAGWLAGWGAGNPIPTPLESPLYLLAAAGVVVVWMGVGGWVLGQSRSVLLGVDG